ncbi:MAG: putative metal-binding motif-containing protein [Deltaproteobacteria bacterium]|nr:putative metal-binding motif-containing protein [Deltaproteobacteria bacterium]
MRSRVLWALLAMVACHRGGEGELHVSAPAKLRQALTRISDLEAGVTLVQRSGIRGNEQALSRAEDGVSFSGFVPAQPGEYVLEVVFRGRPSAGGPLGFLGRLTSDGFTVTQGAVATPTFSQPLDPIGSGADHGDDDGDGLGLLDELLVGSDPTRSDSDGDGIPDGQECDPTVMARSYSILLGGDLRDCDGDGVDRADPPYGEAGTDCDDRDPRIRPGLTDEDCSDGIDQDCNPATCPVDDRDPPTLVSYGPAEGTRLGCHARFTAQITDNSTVASASLELPPSGATPRSLLLTGLGQGLFRSAPLQQVLVGQQDPEANFPVRFRAVDPSGLVSEQPVSYQLGLTPPTITRFTPTELAGLTSPFTVQLEASSPRGISRISLVAVRRTAAGLYRLDQATPLGSAAGGTLSVTVDPATLGDGEVMLAPVVEDPIGNRLQPALVSMPIAELGALTVPSDYSCLEALEVPKVPVRVWTSAAGTYRPTAMREHLDEARTLAAATDPGALFVKVIGFGLRPDGKIDLSDAASSSKRWEYGFYNPNTQRWLTVTWFTPAFATQNPVVDADAGNVVEELPLLDGPGLLDSDQMATAYAGISGCGTLTGHDDDTIIYHRTDEAGGDTVYVSAMDLSWVGTPHLPITTIALCN